MRYQWICTFLEVANCLSFSQAADHLYISQQAVTRQIAALEQELGFRLFYRTTRQVTLTAAGSLLRDDFAQINRQLNDSIRRAGAVARAGGQRLRVGFLSALSRRDIILPITEYLIRACPDKQVEIQLMDFVELRNNILDKRLELCITTSNDYELWPEVQTVVLKRKQFQVVCSERHPLYRCDSLRLEELGAYTQLVLPRETLLEGVEQWGRKIPFRRAVFCPDISTLMVRLELGEGFALLTKVLEGHDAPNLRYWDVPFPEAHAEIVCISPKHAGEETDALLHDLRKQLPIRI